MNKARLYQKYCDEVRPSLAKALGKKNLMSVPAFEKVVVSMGLGSQLGDAKYVAEACEELFLITGQKPVVTKAKKSIAAFKLRKGMPVGCKVTLRRKMMYEFIDRLVHIAFPQIKDFRGMRAAQFDGNGNFALGLKEQMVFPEIEYDNVSATRGMNIVIVTSSRSDEEAKALLQAFNVPFII
ncbi:50S ribosomal protein L5 [Candidatus Cyrtobacter comes]|uniref:Large ribosomal subunit protein uL5 n=1 Tax=Candidatus Cyrtobacter comes TaxID=675776 RepID=A0ABU5L6H7_9RICK|nr:50S ribosomal protein L5 [Candidatus Cyrtobacter comes]MDZ5761734.1 50S ribosomal protein L5 [Candidatus Cyrtobacter comes]